MARPMRWIWRRLTYLAWPNYDCEYCVGQEPQHGCWCAYHGAPAPNTPPEWWRVRLQQLMRLSREWD